MKGSYWVVPPEWVGETCFILGCGPSLKDLYTPDLHKAGRVIAVNDAFYIAPEADVLYFCDNSFWKFYHRDIGWKFRGRYVVTIDSIEAYPSPVKCLRTTGLTGLDSDPQCLRTGGNSGFQAIHLAYHFGATRIVLLGFDMQAQRGRIHWRHRAAERTVVKQETVMRREMLPHFATLCAPLKAAGVEVYNATPRSLLQVWPHKDLTSFLHSTSLPAGSLQTYKAAR